MKKFLLSLATVLCAGSFAFADTATIKIAAKGFTEVTEGEVATYTSDGFTFTLNKETSGTENRLDDTDHLRIYKGASFTVAADDEQTITEIVFTGESGKVSTMKVGDTDYKWNKTSLTWTGEATSVKFDNPNGQTRINSVKITYTPKGGVVVASPEFSPKGGNFFEAQTVELTAGAGATIYYTVNGQDPTDDTADGSTIKYTAPIAVSETTTIKAIAFDADDNKSGIVSETYTIVTLLEGAKGEGTEADPYNAPAAYNAAIMDSTADVYVEGTISSITEVRTQYGNATYAISVDGTETDQFTIYRGYALGGEKFTAEDEIKVGDKVVVFGTLAFKNNVPQLANSKIVSLNGETPTPIELEGDGTENNPFTVADIIKINPTSKDSNTDYPDKYWVKGYVVGYSTSNALKPVFNATDADTQTNIILGPTAECQEIAECIPVQLPTGAVRSALNLKDNPTLLGQEVKVYGNIYSYFSVPGLRNITDYKLASDGIVGVEIEENDAPVVYYNLQGVRVENPANGLYIMRQGDKVTKVIK